MSEMFEDGTQLKVQNPGKMSHLHKHLAILCKKKSPQIKNLSREMKIDKNSSSKC
jgi:hypothetical protein